MLESQAQGLMGLQGQYRNCHRRSHVAPGGAWNPTRVSAVIGAYEAEQVRVRAQLPQCSDNGGVGGALVPLPEYVSNRDIDQLNANGKPPTPITCGSHWRPCWMRGQVRSGLEHEREQRLFAGILHFAWNLAHPNPEDEAWTLQR